MPSFKTEAIILYKRPIWEADRIYTLYTKDYGKVEAQVKSAAKTVSKMAGSLEPVCLAEVMVVKGKSRETITGVQLVKRYQFNSETEALSGLVREIFIKFIKPEVREYQLYQNLKKFFEFIESEQPVLVKRFITQRFIWQMLKILGHGLSQVSDKDGLLKYCLNEEIVEASGLQISGNLLQKLETFTAGYLQNTFENDLNSLNFLFSIYGQKN